MVARARSIALVAVAYALTAALGFELAFRVRQITPVWPPTGIALAALLLGGVRIWPGIFLGAFIANATSGEPLLTAAAIAVGNTFAPLAAAAMLQRAGFDQRFGRVRDAVVFVACGAMLAMTISATNGVAQLALAHIVAWSAYAPLWLRWWTGDASGVLLVTPVILAWSVRRGFTRTAGEAGWVELAAIAALSVLFAALEFLTRLALPFPLYPLAVWASLRGGLRFTTAMILSVSAFALWGTLHAMGPFAAVPIERRVMAMVIFIAMLTIMALVLCALTNERRTALEQVKAAERRFQVLAETLPQIVWTADASGTIDWINQRWERFTPVSTLGIADWPALIARGDAFEREVLLRRDDGAARWFLVRGEPMHDAKGRIVRWYGTHTDVDEQRRALESTSRIATTLQSAFLPASFPQHPRLRFDALYMAASDDVLIGGDWYDAFPLGDGRVVLSIGDVTGHGLNAAVGAARIRQSIVAAALDDADPAKILSKVNRLVAFQESTVATAIVAVVHPRRAQIAYASAGHPAPIVASTRTAAYALPHGSLPLGVASIGEYRTIVANLDPGAVVVFYTDGMTEFARDIESAERSLLEAAATIANEIPLAPAAAVRRAVLGDASPSDDAVVLVVTLLDDADAANAPLTRRAWSFHSGSAQSAHEARREVTAFLHSLAEPDADLFASELILGELLANTVEHAPGLVNLDIDWSGESPVLTVADTGPGMARSVATLPDDTLAEHGRGLFLVQSLARELVIESSRAYGTKLIVTLPLARSSVTLAR